MRSRLGVAFPRSLVFLLAAAAIVGTVWALLVPAWQSPDESAHFGYVQTLAERGDLPGEEGRSPYSTEQQRAALAVNSDQLAQNLSARSVWNERVYDRWRSQQSRLSDKDRSDGGGSNPAGTNPPLFYAFESVPYLVASDADLFGRLYLMRLWNVLLLLVAVTATWLLVGEVFGPRRELQLVGAGLVGLQPMATFITSSINPDAMLIAAFATAFWLGARVIRRGLTLGSGAALCGAAAAAILTKATGYALLPGVAVALSVGAWQTRGPSMISSLARATMPLGALAVPVGAWLVYARQNDRPAINQIAGTGGSLDQPSVFSYLWQFYLPHLPWQQPLPSGYPPLPAIDFWFEGSWGKFGWLEIVWPGPLYVAVGALTLALLVGAAVALLRVGPRAHVPALFFFGLIVAALFGGLHLTEHRVLESQGIAFNQGRYLLPLLPLLGLCGAAALSLVTGRWRQSLVGALLGFLFCLQVASLAIVGARFYA